MVTRVDHIELVVHRFEEYVALFRALSSRLIALKELLPRERFAERAPP